MEIEEKNNALGDSVETPNDNNSSATPADNSSENDEQKEAEKITEDVDPRVVEIVGEDNIKKAYVGNSDEEESETDSKNNDGKSNAEENNSGKENQNGNQEKKEGENVEVNNQIQDTYRPTRLDRRLANRFVRVLHLQGENNIPSEEDILNDLKNYSKDEKINALKHYLGLEKQMRGQKPNNALEEEDKAAIIDAEREEIRREIIEEENTRREAQGFIDFMTNHPELDEREKNYDPILADAVETLFKGGMPINKAYETVISKIEKVKETKINQDKIEKQKALAGSVSASSDVAANKGGITWEKMAKLEREDPEQYMRIIESGNLPER